jgi:hypothetical protein
MGRAPEPNVKSEENTDWILPDFARRVLGASQLNLDEEFHFVGPANDENTDLVDERSAAAPTRAATNAGDHSPVQAIPASQAAEWQDFRIEELAGEKVVSGRPARTASEMADIILNALRSVDGVPERGFLVTVYGANPWNAMLTITPEAGPIKNAQLWRMRVHELGARLRRDFEVMHET